MVDRTDTNAVNSALGVLDLVGVDDRAAVAKKDRASNFLLEHKAHFALQPDNNIQVGDVEDVIPIQLLLLVDRGGAGGPLQKVEDLLNLERPGDVTLGPGLICRDVSNNRLHSSERALANGAHDLANPRGIALEHLRGVGERLCIREEAIDVIDTIGPSVGEERFLERTHLLGLGNDVHESIVAEGVLAVVRAVRGLVEDVAGHSLSSEIIVLNDLLVVFVFIIFVFVVVRRGLIINQLTDDIFDSLDLLRIKRVKNVLNGRFCLLIGFSVGHFILFFCIGMLNNRLFTQGDLTAGIDECFRNLCVRGLSMLNTNIVNDCTFVSAC